MGRQPLEQMAGFKAPFFQVGWEKNRRTMMNLGQSMTFFVFLFPSLIETSYGIRCQKRFPGDEVEKRLEERRKELRFFGVLFLAMPLGFCRVDGLNNLT